MASLTNKDIFAQVIRSTQLVFLLLPPPTAVVIQLTLSGQNFNLGKVEVIVKTTTPKQQRLGLT